jgi:hypothetical protein
MNKLIVLVVLALSSVASAQPAADAPAGSAAPADTGPPGTEEPAPGPAPAANPDGQALCVAALNADPELAKRVLETYNKKVVHELDQQTIDAHNAAAAQIAENERHVIYAYAAMWILAALFLVFMWLRQQSLKAELAALRRDLEAAATETR